MTQMLIAAGCIGDGDHEQRWDDTMPDGSSPVVWRRSVPHGGEWPPLDLMICRLRERGYKVYAVVCSRDWTATARSQAEHWEYPFDAALDNLRTAYPYIMSALLKFQVPYIMVSYESVTEYGPNVLATLLEEIGLTVPDFEVRDENRKRLEVPA
jgi:hypothetical protein